MATPSNGTTLTLMLHGITWTILLALLAISVQIRNNDLNHIADQLKEIRHLVYRIGE
jgi:hypothetical protein